MVQGAAIRSDTMRFHQNTLNQPSLMDLPFHLAILSVIESY